MKVAAVKTGCSRIGRALWLAALTLLSAQLSGCDLAPVYRPPSMLLPASYQGSGPFVVANPRDELPPGPWWRMFGDPILDRLEAALAASNPTLQAAQEAYTQSRDLAAEARSGLYPQLSASGLLSDNKQSRHRLFRGTSGFNQEASNEIAASASWEPDFWDQIRNETRFAKNQAQATAAQVAAVKLSLEGALASDYLALRGLDAQHGVYVQTIRFYRNAVAITGQRLAGKIASALDVARSENQLAVAESLDTATEAQRVLLQNAIAVLAGENAISFDLPVQEHPRLLEPRIPVGVPSELLERRPDIAAAERRMAAENAAIGVSRAAFYPNIRLSALSGFQDNGFNLASLPNSLWEIGAGAILPLFEGGLRRAELQRSWSAYAQATDDYRATVLAAFQQVEDGLSLSRLFATEGRQQHAALQAALRAQGMTLKLYTGGLTNYLDVTVSQIAALSAEIAQAQVTTSRQQAVVGLIEALGGGWSTDDLPTPNQTLPFNPLDLGGSPGNVHQTH
ncbi:efflux transporter outer membrane subunit [Lichenicoccus sp.]|uniref:efflux transporter outer membrane subunit n=1 Tax=Lichenicoccus sp. TaxID=2781899 RepID=UPI003D104837